MPDSSDFRVALSSGSESLNERLHKIFAGANVGIAQSDLAGRILLVNRTFCEILGRTEEAVLGRNMLDVTHPEDRARNQAAFERLVATGEHFQIEKRYLRPNGETVWAHNSVSRIEDTEGDPEYVVAIVQDVTARRQAEEALHRINRELATEVAERTEERDRIWHVSHELLAVADLDSGRFTSVNPAWRTTLGFDETAILSTPYVDFVHSADRERTLAALDRLARGHLSQRFDNRLRHADGSWRWLSWTVVPQGKTIYCVGRDVTDERIAAEALASAEEQLRQAQKMEAVGQLTAGVAHDFNNLLTSVLGNLELIAARSTDQTTQRLVSAAMRGAERGAKLNEQLLAFSRRQALLPQPVDLNRIVGAMGDMLQSTMGASILIETSLEEGLPQALVDPNQLELVILNLAINARDAMPGGGRLTIGTRSATVGPPQRPEDPCEGTYVVLSVSDTGCGMSRDVLARAFEPFFTTKEIGKGSGLGLSMVQGVARQSGGGVRINSQPGDGTSVSVYLPPSHEELADSLVEPRDRSDPAEEAIILLIDDDNDVRDVTAAMLVGLGYQVIEATNGETGLDLLTRADRVDLVLVDFAMPGMNGVETAQLMRAIRPDLPVLFATGYADTAILDQTAARHGIVRKPYRSSELAAKVREALGQSRVHPSAS